MSYVKAPRGFTMVELLMVIVIVSILGSIALPSFLDFRTEAQEATLRQALITIRIALKNQQQNAMLRCGMNYDDFAGNLGANAPAFTNAFKQNDITADAGLGPPFLAQVCTTTQVPNAADRKFVDSGVPTNPFWTAALTIQNTSTSTPSTICAAMNSRHQIYTWIIVFDTGGGGITALAGDTLAHCQNF